MSGSVSTSNEENAAGAGTGADAGGAGCQSDSPIYQDELIMKQQRQIEQEISESIPLIGEKESLSTVEDEYKDDPVYTLKAKFLSSKYSCIRRTRPDGNCFFRAFAYAYLEELIKNSEEFDKFYTFAESSKDKLVSLGFSKFTVEDFYDTFMEVLQRIKEERGKDDSNASARAELHKIFNDQSYSNYVIVYLRLITSGQLQANSEFYHNFIEGDRSIPEFCHQEVEPMYIESDHIHIIALCSALNVGVTVRYMDRGTGGEVIGHDFPDGVPPSVHLLYRPGHYDVLYLR